MKIIELSERPELINEASNYFWKNWGNDSNFIFYKDCIFNSLKKENLLPKFYLAISKNKIIGSYALVTNDIISRQDLMPWLACLYVEEKERKKGLGEKLLNHGIAETYKKGFNKLYLSTDLINFYEKKGWRYLCQGYGVMGDEFKIYEKETA